MIITCADEYQKLAARTINQNICEFEKELHALSGMVSELGELHGLHQKTYQGHKFDYDHAKKELGDLLWFIAEYCTIHEWSLSEIMTLNIQKLINRYPDGFEEVRSLIRKEGDI